MAVSNPQDSFTQAKKTTTLTSRLGTKVIGAVVILIAAVGLVILAIIFWDKLFKPKNIAQFFPVEQTVAFVEINIDPASQPLQELFQILNHYEPYHQDKIEELANAVLQGHIVPNEAETASKATEYTVQNLAPWIGRRAGIAWLYLPEEKTVTGLEALTPVLVAEVKDPKLAQDFATAQKGEFIWQGKHYPFKIIDNELFLTEQASVLAQVENWSKNNDRAKLSDDATYRKVVQNLPQGGLGSGYIQWQMVWKILEEDKPFMQEKGLQWMAFKPFLELFSAEGISFIVDNGKFGAQTFTALKTGEQAGESFLTFSEKYQGELLSLAPADPVFLMGGHDLTKELHRTQEIFTAGTKSSRLLFEGLIQAQVEQYFGKQFDLEKDLYPLLSGEYLLTVEGSFQKPAITLVLEFDDVNNDRALWGKAVDTFVEVSGIFTPHIQEVVLPDGTKGKEIVAQPEKIQRDTIKYNDIEVTDLVLGSSGQTLYYAMLDHAVAISTNLDSLHQLIDRYHSPASTGLTGTAYFQRAIKPVLRSTDQLLQIKLGALLEPLELNKDPNISKYLVPFNNFFMAKNYFADGISTMYLVEVL